MWRNGKGVSRGRELTRIFGVFWTDVFVAGIQDIFVHEGCARSDLAEEADFYRFAVLDALALLDEDLPGVFASIFAV